ncbi:hypothetical protein MNEG_5150 [Monoraphidium neglectum]|uniref:Uncharacterized protein n=1 Tax=Monoraphidium neglectum TaxID=145388 RepID=A0A0D2L7I6_9CHLO|nr:hypothetical protein MNEG_5150 [Monoraphidium neglectum]KIZ02814.1 hypothetical protein MNEG_5150 [Monoraphidium neglectum]|eukprot:XP_013901833.1 hypothetical protein MNEG_5150 [Monoraphidium neglectum]
MGKSKKKNKGKAGIDWEALTAVEPAGGGGSADAGGWQTGPAAMALDGEDGGAPSSSGAVGAPVTEMVMGGTDTQALARRGGSGGGKKHRKKGRGGGGSEAMDTSDAGGKGGGAGKLGVKTGGGMKITGKRGNRTSRQLLRKMAKHDKALAFGEKLQERAAGNQSRKVKKAALKAMY